MYNAFHFPGRLSLWAALVATGCGYGSAVPDAGTTIGADAGDASSDTAALDSAVADVADVADVGAGDVARLGPHGPGAVFVHLFEWKWTDIATECETYLGPMGFAAVQVSPPSEHALIAGRPWWQRYQTVSYSLAKSRSGDADEFRAMVARCAAVGVGIYVDAVLNHTTGQPSGTGSNGTAFTKYSYPGLYTTADFHLPACAIADSDYVNAPDRVRTCELSGLADLATETDHVRDQTSSYLAALVTMGVHGFRLDAAKHMYPQDLDAILRLASTRTGINPYYFLEVIDSGGEAIHATDYLTTGQGAVEAVEITEFKYTVLADAFLNANGKTLVDLRALGDPGGGLLPSDRAVVFVNNHDTQRASSLYYKDGPYYDLATVFMLAWPYGYPSVLSSFAFDRSTGAGRDQGPPSDAAGNTLPVYPPGVATPSCEADPLNATQGWLCEHRRPFVARLIAFRKQTAGAAVGNYWDNGANQLAFSRGNKGFVVINREAAALTRAFATALPAGDYCDVYQGAPAAGGCSGTRVTVDGAGMASLTVAPASAVVIHVGAAAAP
jgi:alpha-amylase